MIDFSDAYNDVGNSDLKPWLESLPSDIESSFARYSHGELKRWHQLLSNLIRLEATELELASSVSVGNEHNLTAEQARFLTEQLMALHPWRKGPFNIHGLHIDTEWRSDWKWQRIKPQIELYWMLARAMATTCFGCMVLVQNCVSESILHKNFFASFMPLSIFLENFLYTSFLWALKTCHQCRFSTAFFQWVFYTTGARPLSIFNS